MPLACLGRIYIQTSAQDEIDALASSRSHSAVDSGTHDGVLLSLLNEMDGVEDLVGVTVIGATNRPEVLVSWAASSRCWVPLLPFHLKMLRVRTRAMRPGRLDRIYTWDRQISLVALIFSAFGHATWPSILLLAIRN